MIPTGPAPVRSLPVRKGPRGVRQVEVTPGRWMDEAVAEAQGIPLVYPLPSNGSGPVTVRHTAPEVPMPAPVHRQPARGPGAQSESQERAWLAVTERGLYWPDVARELGTTSWAVKNMLASYMRRNGIPGEPPGRTPKEEATRRTLLAKGQTPKPSEAPVAHAAPEPPHVKADHLVLAPDGHPWDTDPAPIETLAAPASGQHLGPETEAPPPAVTRVAPPAQSLAIGLAGGGAPPSGGSEPRDTPQGPPVEADGAATTSYRAGDGPPQRGAAGATRDRPGQTVYQPSPVADPEVPPMPGPAPAAPAKPTGRPPSPAQEQAYRAVTERGLYWPDVARELGSTSWSVKNMIQAYMRRNGIPGEPPGRTPKEETSRRTMLAKGMTPSSPSRANDSLAPAKAFVEDPSESKAMGDAAVADRLVLAPEGHPWAADPQPIDVSERGADHAETIPVAEPEIAAPSLGDLTSTVHAPRTGGGGRGVAGDDFLSRIERELDALAREDADLVARARELVEARTAVATRIERLRTAGEVYRAVMAGRAA